MVMDIATETDALKRAVLDSTILEYRYAKLAAAPRFMNKTDKVGGGAYTIVVPYLPTLTVANVTGTTGAVTDSDATVASATITLSLWRSASCTITDQSFFVGKHDLDIKIAQAIGMAIGEDVESQFLDELGANMTGCTDQGDGSGDVSESDLLGAIKQLLDKSLDVYSRPEDFTFVFSTGQYVNLKQMGALKDASQMGSGPGGMLTPKLRDIYGVPTVITPQTYLSTYYYGFLAHREAGAWAMSSEVKLEKMARTVLATQWVGHYAGGVKTIRSDYGVRFKTAR